ncbi:hypothetical protein ACFL6Y_11340 [Elusimicrobiota bacterium]
MSKPKPYFGEAKVISASGGILPVQSGDIKPKTITGAFNASTKAMDIKNMPDVNASKSTKKNSWERKWASSLLIVCATALFLAMGNPVASACIASALFALVLIMTKKQ